MNLILLFLSIVLVNNVITSQFMGICPFLGVSKKVDTAIGMGAAVTFVLTLASFITYFVQKLLEITNNQVKYQSHRLHRTTDQKYNCQWIHCCQMHPSIID